MLRLSRAFSSGALLVAGALLAPGSIFGAGATPATATTQTWPVTGGSVTFSLPAGHLADLGLSISAVRGSVVSPEAGATSLEEPLYSFEIEPFTLTAQTREGVFDRFVGPVSIPARGGFLLRAGNPRAAGPSDPASLFDFSVELTDDGGRCFARIRTLDPVVPAPLEVHHTGFHLDGPAGEILAPLGDLIISESGARQLGRPDLAGRWIGAFELRLATTPTPRLALAPERGPREPDDVLDVELSELYGLESLGRLGAYPNGVSGLSAATTSCNNGTVNVPWNAPMAETHPFIGIAVFRQNDGALEMIGKGYMKHGWYALAGDFCGLDCPGTGGGGQLVVGCADTYSVANNGSRFYLGPRSEINPFTAAWEACGSFFDGTPVDCQRSYMGTAPDEVYHRIEVHDSDLGNPGATYLYEGCYYVADDDTTDNNIGWRECVTSWDGASWQIDTIPWQQLAPNPGTVISTWGDQWDTRTVAPGDGRVVLATQVTDRGGGTWHYEYALYNRDSDRQIRSFSVPVAGAAISNVGFHDFDHDPGSDWSVTVSSELVTWSTDEWTANPNAPALEFQSLFNFRFDADRPAEAASATAEPFKPGPGTTVLLSTQAPSAGRAGSRASPVPAPAFFLGEITPNPFPGSTRLRFAAPERSPVRLSVTDVAGRTVQLLFEGAAPSGVASVTWDGRDGAGARVASGVYFFRLESERGSRTIKGTLRR